MCLIYLRDRLKSLSSTCSWFYKSYCTWSGQPSAPIAAARTALKAPELNSVFKNDDVTPFQDRSNGCTGSDHRREVWIDDSAGICGWER